MDETMMKYQKLSEVANLTVGYVGTMEKEYSETGVFFLRSLNIKPFSIDINDIKYIPKEFHDKLKKSELHTDDVVIVRTGVPGTCSVIPPELDGCNCSDLVIVRPNKKLIDPYYLCCFINSWGKAQVSNAKVGAVQKHFNVASAGEMMIPIMELEKQKVVSNIVKNLNAKINNNTSICSDLENMAKLLYDYWFVQFDFPDENGKPYKSSGGKMVWNEQLKREIPERWEVTSLKPFIRVIRGVSYTPEQVSATPKAGYVPLLKSNNLQNDKLVLDDIIYVPTEKVSQEQYLLDDSIFVTMSSGSTEHVGKTALITYNTPYCYGAFCSKIVIDPNYRCFVSMFFLSDFFKKRIRSIIVGTSIKNINNEHLTENVVALPPKSILKRFEQYCNPATNTA